MSDTWVEVPPGSDFGLDALPYGVFRRRGHQPRVGVAIGRRVLALAVVGEAGLLPEGFPVEVFRRPSLNRFMSLGPVAWQTIRERVTELLAAGSTSLHDAGVAESALVDLAEVELLLPFTVADYVDFYSSREHATNLGRLFRPDSEPLLPNWRYLPVGYHGRAGTVVVSGTPIRRPVGQWKLAEEPAPNFGPSRRLDFELELGFVIGVGSQLGSPVLPSAVEDHLFGVVLVNDWSARDLQAWEYQPLGPFLGKSFATSISPWVLPWEALRPFRVAAPPQDPPPLPYLRAPGNWGLDVQLEVSLRVETMEDAEVVTRTNAAGLYWTLPQQLAHLTSNGARIRTGDLLATGTISGAAPASAGSLIELTEGGAHPLRLGGGVSRAFLADGDTVTIRGWAGGGTRPRVGLGSVTGTVVEAG